MRGMQNHTVLVIAVAAFALALIVIIGFLSGNPEPRLLPDTGPQRCGERPPLQ